MTYTDSHDTTEKRCGEHGIVTVPHDQEQCNEAGSNTADCQRPLQSVRRKVLERESWQGSVRGPPGNFGLPNDSPSSFQEARRRGWA